MSEATPIYEKVANKLSSHLGELSEFSYSALQLLPLPTLLKNLFFNELRREAHEELRRFKSEKFLFGHSSLAPYRSALADAAAKLSVLPREDCLRLLKRSARLTYEYLSRPQHFLSKYLYAESYELKAETIYSALELFVEYTYLPEVMQQYIAKKKPDSLSEERFEKLIADIDKKVCATYTPAEWMHLLEPLYEFYLLGGEAKIPISELQIFLREKDALAALSLLTQLREQGIDALKKEDIAMVFEGEISPLRHKKKAVKESHEFEETVLSHLSQHLIDEVLSKPIDSEEPTAQLPIPEDEPPLSPNIFPKVTHRIADSSIPTSSQSFAESANTERLEPVASQPLSGSYTDPAKERTKEADNPTATPLPPKTETPLAASSAEVTQKQDELELPQKEKVITQQDIEKAWSAQSEQATQVHSGSSGEIPKQISKSIHRSEPSFLPVVPPVKTSAPSELKDLRALISQSDRKKIIKRVFNGSEGNYERAINELNQKKTWREASLYLDQEIFKRFDVDEYSMEAVRLTDTVFERHFNKT